MLLADSGDGRISPAKGLTGRCPYCDKDQSGSDL